MAVQEVRWDGSGSLKAHGQVKILYSGLEKHERGVGFIIKNKLLSNIVKFEPLSDRLCYIEFKCRWFNIVKVNCYAPTEDKSGEVKNTFYDELDRICDQLPSGNQKLSLATLMQKLEKKQYTDQLLGMTVYMMNPIKMETN